MRHNEAGHENTEPVSGFVMLAATIEGGWLFVFIEASANKLYQRIQRLTGLRPRRFD